MVKLSVVIPVYNTEKYLVTCLDSVFNSDLKEIEILVIDDGSRGQCKEIVNTYLNKDLNIRYFKHKYNKGLFAARLTGMKMARGDYLVHLDPDDTVTPTIYKTIYDKACNSKSDLVLFNAKQIDTDRNEWIEKNNILEPFTQKSGIELLNNIFKSCSQDWIWHVAWNKLIKKNIVSELITLFKADLYLSMYEDLLWSTAIYLFIGTQMKCSAVDTFGLRYLRHNEAITKLNDEKTNIKKLDDVCTLHDEIELLLKRFNYFHIFKIEFRSTIATLAQHHLQSVTNKYKLYNSEKFHKLSKIISNYYVKHRSVIPNDKIIKNAIQDLSQRIITDRITDLMIYGTGEFSLKLKSHFEQKNIHVRNFIVTNSFHNENLEGVQVIDIKKAVQQNCSTIVIASFGSASIIRKIILDRCKSSKTKIDIYSTQMTS